MKKRFKHITLQEIPDITWEGYYWYSSESKPMLIENEKISKELFTAMPFVVEANFYNRELAQSVQVKNIDGIYVVSLIDLKDFNGEERTYMGHDIGSNFIIVEGVQTEQDPLLENMDVKVPVWHAFKGFVSLKKH